MSSKPLLLSGVSSLHIRIHRRYQAMGPDLLRLKCIVILTIVTERATSVIKVPHIACVETTFSSPQPTFQIESALSQNDSHGEESKNK